MQSIVSPRRRPLVGWYCALQTRPRLLTAAWPLALVALAECLTDFGDPRFGMAAQVLLLVLFLGLSVMHTERGAQTLFLALTVAPLLRIVGLGLPLGVFPHPLWYLLVSLPMASAAILIARLSGLGPRALGLCLPRPRYLPLELAVGASGAALGYLEWLMLRPAPLAPRAPLSGLLAAGLVLLLCSGFLEELLFRGLIQRAAGTVLGARTGIVFTALLYAGLHIAYRSLLVVAFVAAVSLYFGLIVRRTQSLLGVTLAHGMVNLMLFVLLPLATGTPTAHQTGYPAKPLIGQSISAVTLHRHSAPPVRQAHAHQPHAAPSVQLQSRHHSATIQSVPATADRPHARPRQGTPAAGRTYTAQVSAAYFQAPPTRTHRRLLALSTMMAPSWAEARSASLGGPALAFVTSPWLLATNWLSVPRTPASRRYRFVSSGALPEPHVKAPS